MLKLFSKRWMENKGFTPPFGNTPNFWHKFIPGITLPRNAMPHGQRAGFTLIELLVVIAIIGVLASIVLASLNSARKKTRDTRRITDLKQIQLALELYFDAQDSQYPVASVTCTGVPTAGTEENNGLQDLVIKGYIPQISRDPLSTSATPICYRYAALISGARVTYHLGAGMEDPTIAVLTGDQDQAITAGWTNDFDGTSIAPNNLCDATPGIPQGQTGATEKCYDVVP